MSPVLANIYLHELDMFVQAEMEAFNRGRNRRPEPRTNVLNGQMVKLRQQIARLDPDTDPDLRQQLITKVQELNKQKHARPSGDPFDPHFRRLKYVRYADDFLLGVIGSRAEAEAVLDRIKVFLKDTLQLDVSPEKTKVVKSAEGVMFLDYTIRTKTGNVPFKVKRNGFVSLQRPAAEHIILQAPEAKLQAFCNKKHYGDYDRVWGTHRPYLINSSDYEIMSIFNAELRGLATYYRLDRWIGKHFHRLHWIAQQSLMRTLAGKHRTQVGSIMPRMRLPDGNLAVRYTHKGKECRLPLWRPSDLQNVGRPATKADIDADLKITFNNSDSDMVARLNAGECENTLCQSPPGTPTELHHTKRLVDMKDAPFLDWVKAARGRKTRALCGPCHRLIHSRTPHEGKIRLYATREPDELKGSSPVRREGALQSP